MGVALQSQVERRRRPKTRPVHPAKVLPFSQPAVPSSSDVASNVHPLPAPPTPLWLIALAQLYRGSTVTLGMLLGTALLAYAWSASIDRQLHQQTRRLAALEQTEQQLTTANEILKNHMAQEAQEPATGFLPSQPNRVLFLEPAPPRTLKSPSTTTEPQPPQAPPRVLSY